MYPYIVPQSITIWQAAAPENSQLFMLFGVAVLIPLILGLYRLGLLGVPRQGQARKRLSLMPQDRQTAPLTQRLLWFAALWLGGVGAVAIVSFGLRLWLAPK